MINGASASPFIRNGVDWMESLAGNVTHLCGQPSRINFSNVTVSESALTRLFPAGYYSASYSLYDKLDANVINITSQAIVTK
jgi:hypothetical protein